MSDHLELVYNLVKKAAKAEKSEDAMRFSQAATNASNALFAAFDMSRQSDKTPPS